MEIPRASQDEFTKNQNVTEKDNLISKIGYEKLVESEKHVSWRDALVVVAEIIHQVKPEEIVGVAGKLSDAESMILLKDFLNILIGKGLCFLLVGTQPMVEAAMVNTRIRKCIGDGSYGYRGMMAEDSQKGSWKDYDVDEEEDEGENNVVMKKKIGRKSMASWGGEPRTSQKNEKSKKGTPWSEEEHM
ncbi:hypothetical protein Tco_0840590 [Tanacetum coccineum]|uniref:Molybdopterin oxidoreductase domain-containing protein n=1 Tax=Tanacetum coccineum TaxID=301880 RepID=A0ABQ5AUT6_9ASTR